VVVSHADASVTTTVRWTEWKIPLTDFTGAGVTVTAVKAMAIRTHTAPTVGGAGVVAT
jgi:hypothetical protein